MNTQCQRTARDALLYRDGGQSPSEQRAFADHLPGCSACRARLADAQALNSLLREAFDLSTARLPEGFADRVMTDIAGHSPARAKIEKRGAAPGWWESLFAEWRWFVLGGLAVAAAVATVVLPAMQGSHDAVTPTSEAEQEVLRQENEAHVHRLSVDSAGTHPVVLQTAEGRTVIWMISDSQFGADANPQNP
jgi:anti-sigma factor RsiW